LFLFYVLPQRKPFRVKKNSDSGRRRTRNRKPFKIILKQEMLRHEIELISPTITVLMGTIISGLPSKQILPDMVTVPYSKRNT
jgi:hypothetical protein